MPNHPDAIAEALEEPLDVKLTIPNAISCAPARTWRIGGQHRVHPGFSSIVIGDSIATMQTPNWGLGAAKSVVTRSAVTFHRRMGSFQFLSVKTGRMMSGLGPYEQILSEELEADPNKVDYDLQGLLVDWNDGPTYLLDYHAHDAVLGLVAGEVKADPSYFIDPGYSPTMINAGRTLANVGVTFQKVDGATLVSNPIRRRNVRRAYCDRFTKVSKAQRGAVADLLARNEVVKLGEVHAILANDSRLAQLLVHALLCRRVLAYDLDLPLDRDTAVSAPVAATTRIDIRNLQLSEAD